jgi:hypothetical protein
MTAPAVSELSQFLDAVVTMFVTVQHYQGNSDFLINEELVIYCCDTIMKYAHNEA